MNKDLLEQVTDLTAHSWRPCQPYGLTHTGACPPTLAQRDVTATTVNLRGSARTRGTRDMYRAVVGDDA